jgi:hypothetical protein
MRSWKREVRRNRVGGFLLVLAASISLWAGSARSLPLAAARLPGPGAGAAFYPERVLREIVDPHSGEHWLLVPNPADPAGPGQWVRSGPVGGAGTRHEEKKQEVVIRRGDRVVMEELSATVEAYLEATALESAAAGSWLHVRLTIGGRVVKVLAVAAGRTEVEP